MTIRTITFDDEQWQVVPKILAPVMWHAMLASPTESMAWSAALASAPEPQVCFCDEKGIGDPAKSCGDCPRDYGMPTVRANPEPPAQQPHDPEEPSAINFDIRPGSQWTHRNGNRYTVVATANEHSTDPERYPITVVYLGTNGRLWSRRADDWHRSMTPEPPAQPRRPYGTDTMSEYGVIPECDGSEPPAQQQDEQLPPYSAWLHVLDEAMVVRHLGVADPDDDYITAKRKLHAMFDWEIDVATDPAVGGDRVRKQQPMTKTELVVALKPVLDAIFANETVPPAAWEASVRNVEQFHGIGKGESNAD